MRQLVICLVLITIASEAFPEDPRVVANAKFARDAVEGIHSIQHDLEQMKVAENNEIMGMKSIKGEIKAMPNAKPGQFKAEERAVDTEAQKMTVKLNVAIKDEDKQQLLAKAALGKTTKLISAFGTAGVVRKKSTKRLGEASPAEVAKQVRNAKAALSQLKDVASVLGSGVKTSHTKDLLQNMQKEAKKLQQEALGNSELGDSPLDSALDHKLQADAESANFKGALEITNKAAQSAMKKEQKKRQEQKTTLRKTDHASLLSKETDQLTTILKQEAHVVANEKAASAEVQSLWNKLN